MFIKKTSITYKCELNISFPQHLFLQIAIFVYIKSDELFCFFLRQKLGKKRKRLSLHCIGGSIRYESNCKFGNLTVFDNTVQEDKCLVCQAQADENNLDKAHSR